MANSSVDSYTPIGYYVHHHGTGHMQRAITICQRMSWPVVMLSSLEKPTNLPSNVTFIQLVSDVVENYQQPADSIFHYTPYASAIFKRNQQLIDAWQQYDIREMYVDVSIEIAVLAKLYGLTVGYALMQGVRTDAAHTYGYDSVDYLLAHCAPNFDDPANHHTATPIRYSGGISRLQKRSPTPLVNTAMPAAIAVAVSPQHESDVSDAVLQCAAQFPNTTWHIIGQKVAADLSNVVSHGIVESPESLYEQCDIIIGSGGTNTIMEAASMAKPFICIPEDRPFDEQITSAKSLQRLNAAVYQPDFPKPDEWPALLTTLIDVNLQVFSALVTDDAALKAAQIIETAGH